PFFSLAPQGMQEALSMMLAFRVARDLGANHSRSVVIILRAVHATDRPLVEQFDFECACRRAIVRTGRKANPLCFRETKGLIHGAPIIEDRLRLYSLPELWIASRRRPPPEQALLQCRRNRFRSDTRLLGRSWHLASRQSLDRWQSPHRQSSPATRHQPRPGLGNGRAVT